MEGAGQCSGRLAILQRLEPLIRTKVWQPSERFGPGPKMIWFLDSVSSSDERKEEEGQAFYYSKRGVK